MPKGTRVGRCIEYLKHKYGYGPAIGICQKSTKQNYMTGKKTFIYYLIYVMLITHLLNIFTNWQYLLKKLRKRNHSI